MIEQLPAKGISPMIWDIFFNRNRERRNKEKDEIDLIVDVTEKFAPKQYLPEAAFVPP